MFTEINPAPNRERQTVQVPCQSHRPKSMLAGGYLKFRNDRGVREIRIGGEGIQMHRGIPAAGPPAHLHQHGRGGHDPLSLLRDGVPLRASIDTTLHHSMPNRRTVYLLTRTRPDRSLSESRSTGTGKPTRTVLPQANAYAMVRRLAAAAGIATKLGNHSFRATGITAYLKNGGTLEKAAAMANHTSTRTTQLYDRRRDEVSLDEVDRTVANHSSCPGHGRNRGNRRFRRWL
jgi:Phage integrase family